MKFNEIRLSILSYSLIESYPANAAAHINIYNAIIVYYLEILQWLSRLSLGLLKYTWFAIELAISM